jgi:hypothetical protein
MLSKLARNKLSVINRPNATRNSRRNTDIPQNPTYQFIQGALAPFRILLRLEHGTSQLTFIRVFHKLDPITTSMYFRNLIHVRERETENQEHKIHIIYDPVGSNLGVVQEQYIGRYKSRT